jgi:hypothetical protein
MLVRSDALIDRKHSTTLFEILEQAWLFVQVDTQIYLIAIQGMGSLCSLIRAQRAAGYWGKHEPYAPLCIAGIRNTRLELLDGTGPVSCKNFCIGGVVQNVARDVELFIHTTAQYLPLFFPKY